MLFDAPPDLVRIRLLGTTDVSGPAGDEGRIVEQPKVMALLAYIAVARPFGFHRRERLLALFWPDQLEDRARASLRHGLHQIREIVGDIVVRRGDVEVGLDPARVWVDVREFDAAIAADRLAYALELYRGRLLESVPAPSAALDQWLDVERRRVRADASDAAWQLAQRYEHDTDLTTATRWARRAARLAYADERRVRSVMSLLDRLGDGAGAIAVYEEFSAELRNELDLAPSDETRALAETIRRR